MGTETTKSAEILFGPCPTQFKTNIERIWEMRPLLRNVIESSGKQTLTAFATNNLSQCSAGHPERMRQLIDAIAEVASERLGHENGAQIKIALQRHYSVSSADHHGSLNSGLALTANGLLSHASSDPLWTIVLSCATVSLNNQDQPRGLIFHSDHNSKITKQVLSILPSNSHASLVYGFRPYRKDEIEKVQKTIRERVRNGEIAENIAKKIQSILYSVYLDTHVLNAKTLCEQFTIANALMWRFAFPTAPTQLAMIELEEIVTRMLRYHHLHTASPIASILFDPIHATTVQSLQSAMAPFVRQGQIATDYFWGISEHSHQRRTLKLIDSFLVSEDRSICIPWQPEAIDTALLTKKIVPGLFISYLLLHCTHGLNCMGGFNQMHYLAALKEAYDASEIDPIKTTGNPLLYQYGLDLISVTDGILREPASALDLLLYGEEDLWEKCTDMFAHVTLIDAFLPSAGIIDGILHPALS